MKYKLRWKFPRSATVIFVPHSQQSIYKFRITGLLAAIILLFSFSIFCSSFYAIAEYIRHRNNLPELQELRTVNKQQFEELQQLESRVVGLESKLAELDFLENGVRVILEEEGLAVGGNMEGAGEMTRVSRGGGYEFTSSRMENFGGAKQNWDELYLSLDALEGAMEELNDRLGPLESNVEVLEALFESRPNGLPVNGSITSVYGHRKSPFSGRTEYHPGLDLAANYGDRVVATGKGKVVFSGYKSGYGNTVVIEHPFDYTTIYGHNSKLNVQEGDMVERGGCIALVGSSGASTGPHVHYEIYHKGVRVDPEDYL